MAKAKYHLADSPIPQGYQIYEDRLEVAGVAYRKGAVADFIRGRDHRLDLERDPGNKADRNAIKVMGYSRGAFLGKWRHLGYVPAEVADRIVRGNFWGQVNPRLLKTYLGGGGFVEVEFQLLGPTGRTKEYKEI